MALLLNFVYFRNSRSLRSPVIWQNLSAHVKLSNLLSLSIIAFSIIYNNHLRLFRCSALRLLMILISHSYHFNPNIFWILNPTVIRIVPQNMILNLYEIVFFGHHSLWKQVIIIRDVFLWTRIKLLLSYLKSWLWVIITQSLLQFTSFIKQLLQYFRILINLVSPCLSQTLLESKERND